MRKFIPSFKTITVAVLTGLVAMLFLSTSIASAGILDEIGKLFTATDTGLSFDQFQPSESLTLQKEGYNEALTASSDLKEFIIKIVNFALTFLGIIAVIIIIYGGFLYVTAAGEEDNTLKGKKAIQYATIGLLIVMGSFAFVNTVISSGSGVETVDKKYIVGINTGSSFNGSAMETMQVAQKIYDGFALLATVEEDIRNIVSESQKSTLQVGVPNAEGVASTSTVAKGNVLNFLFKTRDKLSQIRTKVAQFSQANSNLSELIRQLGVDIDNIQNTNDDTLWPVIQKEFVSTDQGATRSLVNIFTPIKQNYLETLNEQFTSLIGIRQSLSGINAVEGGGIGEVYNKMRDNFGYKDDFSSTTPNSFLSELEAWNLSNIVSDAGGSAIQVNKVGAKLFEALKNQLEFAKKLSELKSVEARLRANVVSGNAPLIVTFDVLDSLDPAGGSIVDKNIDWSNLAGRTTFEGDAVDIGDAVQCENVTETDKNIYGPAFRQCTFKYPGTYTATVTIKSNNPGKFASGMSRLTIKVNPPTTKINLNIDADGKTIPVMNYYENGILKTSLDYITATLDEAKKGIVFDASKTENVQNFKWDFGNGKTVITDNTGVQSQSFTIPGKYRIALEVMNKLGEIDRNVFTLDVRNVAARIEVRPSENIFISNAIFIDGSASSSAGGKLKAYEWGLSKILAGKTESVDLKGNANKASFTYRFDEPGKYKLDLKVSSELDTVATEYALTVESQPPVAIMKYNAGDKSQPSTISFDGSASFDPDGKNTELKYEWTIDPKSNNNENWSLVSDSTLNEKDPIIKFHKKGKYQVKLRVTDVGTVQSGITEEFGEVKKDLELTNVLDVAWANNQGVSSVLDETGKAEMSFTFNSDNAIAYEISYGDSKIDTGQMTKTKTVKHTYDKAGKYEVNVTVYDQEDNDNRMKRRVFIGGGEKPVAQIAVSINGVRINDLSEKLTVGKKDSILFDASGSKNTDGTGRDLQYSWDFGDTKNSSQKSVTHIYKDLSPKNIGYYTAQLKVIDKDDPTKVDIDEITIDVINMPPKLSSIQMVPDISNPKLITPVTVDLKAFGAEDPDGEITQYKWWYYNVDNPDEPLGLQITKSASTKIILGTNGKQGATVNYGFGLQLVDSDNLSINSHNILEENQIPKISVINGLNAPPTAKVSVDKSNVYTGDKVTFTSKSTDPDGEIAQYIWDFEGDGFFNDTPTKEASVTHVYTAKKADGYMVRLKVIDDKGGEAISDPIRVFVDSLSKAPTSAFNYEYVEGSKNMKIKFINTSTPDEGAKIMKNIWDFDTDSNFKTADSDGDGNKSNDEDSLVVSPERLYTESGLYKVKLTVVDNQGNKSEIIKEVGVGTKSGVYTPTDPGGLLTGIGITTPQTKPDLKPSTGIQPVLETTPKADVDGIVYIQGDTGYVTFDFTKSSGPINYYIFDKNIYIDSNANGIKNDDQDFKTSLPGTWKTSFSKAYGKTVVKLTITDLYGNKKEINQEIKFK